MNRRQSARRKERRTAHQELTSIVKQRGVSIHDLSKTIYFDMAIREGEMRDLGKRHIRELKEGS